MDEVILHH